MVPVLVATRRFCQSYKFSAIRGDAPPPGNCVDFVTFPSPMPPYSPELNPVENLWHYLRSHHWSNRKYATVDDLFEAAETAWRAACLDPAVIQTVCHAPYAETRC